MDEKNRHIHEVSIDMLSDSPIAGYVDGDIAIIDDVKQLQESPGALRAKLNFIILCVEGRIQLDVNGQRRMLEKNQLLFSCPGVVLDNYMLSPDFECRILCLSERIILALLHDHVEVWNRAVYVRRVNVLPLQADIVRQYALYHALVRQSMQLPDRRYAKQAMQSLVQALLFDLCSVLEEHLEQATTTRPTQGALLFDRFLHLLSQEPKKRRAVGYYALQLAVTPKYLTMVCEQYGGKPAKEWINQYVVEDVRYLLLGTQLTIKEIADRLGFANISHFGTYVRRHFGMSPSAFRSGEVSRKE